MRVPAFVIATLLLLAIVIVGITLVPPSAGSASEPHARFSTMSRGSSGPGPSEPLFWLGAAFGGLTVILCAGLMAWGVRRGSSLRGIGPLLIATTTLNLAAWGWLLSTYAQFPVRGTDALFLGFPAPSAILVYVLYPVTSLFNLLYVAAYRRSVLSDADIARYRALVEQRARRNAAER